MQHLDEGTIHSWLDGALGADEAARVEAHVAGCAQCQTAVAEARGFIAASSRILTALDNVPRGVVPAAAPRKRVDPMVWRVAATLLVVAGGTLIVVRDNASEKQPAATTAESVEFSQSARGGPGVTTSPSTDVASQAAPAQAPPIMNPRTTPTAVPTPKGAPARPSGQEGRKTQLDGTAADNRLAQTTTSETRQSVRQDQAAPAVGQGAGVVTPSAPRPTPNFAPMRARAVGAMDAAAEPTALRVVGTPHVIGERRTLYELAPGDTVLLAEAQSVRLESITMSGAAQGRAPAEKAATVGAAASTPTTAAPPPPPPDSRRRAAASSNVVVPQAESVVTSYAANGVTTLTWKDPATGNVMKLSGRHSREELLEIRRRIEQARAAEAAKK